jgi:hypothetical protein
MAVASNVALMASRAEEPLPRNPGGKVLKAQLREQTIWGQALR